MIEWAWERVARIIARRLNVVCYARLKKEREAERQFLSRRSNRMGRISLSFAIDCVWLGQVRYFQQRGCFPVCVLCTFKYPSKLDSGFLTAFPAFVSPVDAVSIRFAMRAKWIDMFEHREEVEIRWDVKRVLIKICSRYCFFCLMLCVVCYDSFTFNYFSNIVRFLFNVLITLVFLLSYTIISNN